MRSDKVLTFLQGLLEGAILGGMCHIACHVIWEGMCQPMVKVIGGLLV
jgi:hypothetical protein